jgi:hypothetical protein
MSSAVLRVLDAGADHGGQNGGREDSDAVGAEVLQEPGHRGENGPAQMNAGEQRRPRRMLVRLCVGDCGADRSAQDDLFRIWRIAAQQPRGRHLGLFDPPTIGEPERALDHEKTADDDRHGEQDGAGIHPAPGADIGIFVQDQKSDGRARKATNGLKAECRKHHAPRMRLGILSEMIRCAVG